MFSDVEILKETIREETPDSFFEKYILNSESVYFDRKKIDFVCEKFVESYNIELVPDNVVVVGSSKLGFALHTKRRTGMEAAPAFRSFSAESDIDIAICCPNIFNILWHEISDFLNRKTIMPYRQNKLGDYLAYGWLRHDHLPYGYQSNLHRCHEVKLIRGKVRKDRQFGHPYADFGIFHDLEHLQQYQSRSVLLCKNNLENPL